MSVCRFLNGGSPGDEPSEVGHLTSRVQFQCRTGERHASIIASRNAHCLGLSASPGKHIFHVSFCPFIYLKLTLGNNFESYQEYYMQQRLEATTHSQTFEMD